MWEQLFVVVGCNRFGYSGLFKTVLDHTISDATIKLIDIEVIFLSFFLVVKNFPDILTLKYRPGYLPVDRIELRKMLENHAQSYFFYYQIALHNLNVDNNDVKSDIDKLYELEIEKKILMLQNWIPTLESLSLEHRILISKAYILPDFLNFYVEDSYHISKFIYHFSNLKEYWEYLERLFEVLIDLYNDREIDYECFGTKYIYNLLSQYYPDDKINPSIHQPILEEIFHYRIGSSKIHNNQFQENFNKNIFLSSVTTQFDNMEITESLTS